MGKVGHHLTGIASGIITAITLKYSMNIEGVSLLVMLCIGGWIGGTAPDYLEVAWASKKIDPVTGEVKFYRKSIIPHRTITHWLIPWVLITASLWIYTFNQATAESWGLLFAVAFTMGSLMHLLMDLPNYTGIPILTPFAKSRYGLKWAKSGNALEVPFSLVLIIICFFIYAQ